jgi:predicted glutamine amidotransferase
VLRRTLYELCEVVNSQAYQGDGGWFATFSQRTQTVTNSQLLIQVDFATETTVNDVVTVIATQALTTNETWQSFEPNELMVFEQGELNYQVKATD